MFGRKAKRIAELEAQLKDARENLAVAVVPTGLISQRIEVRKGQWYVVSFRCRHNGGAVLDVANLFMGEEERA